tara:strand:- start:109963 stop:110550 length:588 start_codon:yes stop_codon:yes gene_type:complete
MSRLVGNTAPDFKAQALVKGDFQDVSLGDFKGKWKILFFYPLDFTFVCPTEIIAFSDAAAKFSERNCEVIACSVDSVFSHLAWTEQSRDNGGLGEVNFPILSDINKTIAKDYEVLTEEGVALRGLFLIDDNNVIQHATINNLSVGRNVDEALRLLKGYQFTAEKGEVCPANWNEGDLTMTPDPTKSKDYFKKANA